MYAARGKEVSFARVSDCLVFCNSLKKRKDVCHPLFRICFSKVIYEALARGEKINSGKCPPHATTNINNEYEYHICTHISETFA